MSLKLWTWLRGGVVAVALGAAGLAPASALASTPLLIAPFAGPLSSPQGVALSPAGDVYVADAGANQVLRVTPAGAVSVLAGTGAAGAATPGPASQSRLAGPRGVAVDAAGDVYIADTGNAEVEKVTPGGTLSVIAGTGGSGAPSAGPALSSPLGSPAAVAVDAAGNVYVADAGARPYVEKLSPAGALSILAGNGTSGLPVSGPATHSPLRTPDGVAVDPAGNVYIADAANNLVEKVTAAGTLSVFAGRSSGAAGAPTGGTPTGSHLTAPAGVAVDPSGTNVYIADTGNNRVEQVSAGRLSTIAGTGTAAAPSYGAVSTASALPSPRALAVTSSGVAYVADSAGVDRLIPAPPTASAAPTVTGTATEAQTLSAGNGSWNGSPTAYTYQWQRCDAAGAGCTAIGGATAASYMLTAADDGQTVRALVTAANPGGTGSAASAPSGVVIPLPPYSTNDPSIAGSPIDGQTLTAQTGGWSGSPTRFGYQWQLCDGSGANCTSVGGATTAAYTLQTGDIGATLRVVVTATNAGGHSSQASAASAVAVPALNPWANVDAPAALAAPRVLGAALPGATLSCAAGTWTGSPSLAYQWNRDNQPLSDTSPTYTVSAADAGHALSCSVLASNDGGEIQADSARVTVSTTAPSARAAGARTVRTAGKARSRRTHGKRHRRKRAPRHAARKHAARHKRARRRR